jgi:hypothetical protein
MSSLHGAYSDAGTDYTKAKTDFWTSIKATESLEIINSIICFTQHLRPELMVNKGVYSALINNTTCSSTHVDRSKSQNDYIIANVTRESNTSPQVMNIWIPKDNVKVRVEVTKEASEADSFGQFNITWQFFDQNEALLGKGELKTVSLDSGNIGLTMFIDYDDSKSSISIDKKPDGSQGIAFTKDSHGHDPKTYALVWDNSKAENLVLSKKHDGLVDSITDFNGDTKICQDRSTVDKSVWSYGVYKEADGSLYNIKTGLSFEATKDGKTIHGYLGHWGIWIEGDTVEGKSLDLLTNIKEINYADNIKTNIKIEKNAGKYIAKYYDGKLITINEPVTLTNSNDNTTYTYGGSGSLWNSSNTNSISLSDGTILSDGTTNYVVKALQIEKKLGVVNKDSCSELELKEPASLPTSFSNNAVFNEDSVPTRPENISFIDGVLQN